MMTQIEKGIFNRGRMNGISNCLKRLSQEENDALYDVCAVMADEMCKAGDDLFRQLENEALTRKAEERMAERIF